jgi:hypothetical protein
VDAFIAGLPDCRLLDWQQAVCRQVRDLVHAAVEETIKRTDRPYFVLAGNICAFQPAKTRKSCSTTTPDPRRPARRRPHPRPDAAARPPDG